MTSTLLLTPEVEKMILKRVQQLPSVPSGFGSVSLQLTFHVSNHKVRTVESIANICITEKEQV